MDWSNFDKSYEMLKNILRDLIGNGKDKSKVHIYANCITYAREVKIIVKRVEEDIQEEMRLSKEFFEMGKTGKEPGEEFLDSLLENYSMIRLDTKSFFIFPRIFIDTLAKVVRLSFGKKGEQLHGTMTQLLKDDMLQTFDPDFANGLRSRMSRMDAFVETRVEIEHHLGNIMQYITTKNGRFGFVIQGSRSGKEGFLGTDKIESMTDYMENVLSHLSEVTLYICSRFPSYSSFKS